MTKEQSLKETFVGIFKVINIELALGSFDILNVTARKLGENHCDETLRLINQISMLEDILYVGFTGLKNNYRYTIGLVDFINDDPFALGLAISAPNHMTSEFADVSIFLSTMSGELPERSDDLAIVLNRHPNEFSSARFMRLSTLLQEYAALYGCTHGINGNMDTVINFSIPYNVTTTDATAYSELSIIFSREFFDITVSTADVETLAATASMLLN